MSKRAAAVAATTTAKRPRNAYKNPLTAAGGIHEHVRNAATRLAKQPSSRKISVGEFCREMVLAREAALPDFYVGMGQLMNWPSVAKQAISATEWSERIHKPGASPVPPLPPLPRDDCAEPRPAPTVAELCARIDAALAPVLSQLCEQDAVRLSG
eukprot:832657-Prymnesium_polylepis.1